MREAPIAAGIELAITVPPGNMPQDLNIEEAWEVLSESFAEQLVDGLGLPEGFDIRTAIRASRHGITHLVLSLTRNA